MADLAHKYTDEQLEALERRFQSVYSEAEKDVTVKLTKHLESFSAKDEVKKKQLANGQITQTDYNKWRQGQVMTGKRWQELRDNLAHEYTNANQIAMSALNGHLPDVYANNFNWSTYQIEHGTGINTNFTLYDRQTVERLVRDNPNLLPHPSVDIPKDLRWNSQKITSAVTQGILQGESIPKIAKRMQNVTDMNNSAAVRNARTAMTGAQNAGRVDSYKRAEDMGIEMEQEWLATLDGRTRHSHRLMDGERVKVGETFSNGCEYPGDPAGDPEEVYNCRCTLIAALDGFTHDADDLSLRYDENLEDMTYEEWKYEHEKEHLKNNDYKPNNIFGEKIEFDERIVKDEKYNENIDMINLLASNYETKLKNVYIGQAQHGRMVGGSVDVSGTTMYISDRSLSTTIHEFAHTISIENQTKFGLYDEKGFWQEIKSIQRKYKKSVSDNSSMWISWYEHSSKGADEFMAEAFTLSTMREYGIKIPEKYNGDTVYSNMVLEIIKKYFGKHKKR